MSLLMDLTGDLAREALRIVQTLSGKGHTAYFAGGCVRDALRGTVPSDFDIATTATPDEVEALFPKTVSVGRQFGVMLVLSESMTFEVATFRKEGGYVDGRHPTEVAFTVPQQDALRRDFTVNGLFYDPQSGEVIDFVGGRADLERRLIRAIGDPGQRFTEDKLRILRAVRFAATLHFEIEAATWQTVRAMAGEVQTVSPERIRDEISKMITRPGAGRGLELLLDSGLLRILLPELEALRGVSQQEAFHPEGDVWEHTRLLVDRLHHPSLVLAWSALLHDIGKPRTFAVRNDKITFYEHAPVGGKIAREIMMRLRFSNDEIEQVATCIDQHMAFADVRKMRSGKLKRMLARSTFPEELELHRADCEASHGMMENFDFLREKMKEYAAEDLKPKPFVNGHDLQTLGMKPGPPMKPLLEELYDLQLEGALKSREEALEFAARRLSGS
ncbi:MAG: CCA tRNA nucleotidyltransferase [Candidatus Omnitrophota bacterium]|jgi:poly(A) polymerase